MLIVKGLETDTPKLAASCTLIKKKIKFFSYIRKEGSGAKSYMTNGLLICGEKLAHFLIY